MGAAWILYAMSLLGQGSGADASFRSFGLGCLSVETARRGQRKMVRTQVRRVWWEKIPFLLAGRGCRSQGGVGKRSNREPYIL